VVVPTDIICGRSLSVHLVDMNSIFMKLCHMGWNDQRDLKVTYLRNLNFRSDFLLFLDLFLIRLKVSRGETLVKYFAPREITMVKIMNNLNVCSAHSYLYPRSRSNDLLPQHRSSKTQMLLNTCLTSLTSMLLLLQSLSLKAMFPIYVFSLTLFWSFG
jgi:hypothetical protein